MQSNGGNHSSRAFEFENDSVSLLQLVLATYSSQATEARATSVDLSGCLDFFVGKKVKHGRIMGTKLQTILRRHQMAHILDTKKEMGREKTSLSFRPTKHKLKTICAKKLKKEAVLFLLPEHHSFYQASSQRKGYSDLRGTAQDF